MTKNASQGTATATAAHTGERGWDEDLPVVTNTDRILRPAAAISRFSDDVWSLAPIAPERIRSALSLNFQLVPAQFRVPVKAAMWIAINEGLPDQFLQRGGAHSKKFQAAGTIRAHFSRISLLLRGVVELQPEVRSLRGITDEAMNKHISALANPAIRAEQMASARLLHDITQGLDARNRLPAPAWLDETGSRRDYGGENRTPIMPVDVATPLLLWAVAFVNEFSDDILAADTAVNVWGPKEKMHPNAAERDALIDGWLAQVGSVVPSTMKAGKPGFALTYVCFRLDHPQTYARGFGQPLTRYGVTLSPDTHCPVGTPVNGQIHARTWQPRGLDFYEIATWRRHLQTAAMIVLGFNAATRPEELLNLEIQVESKCGETQPVLERVEAPDGQVRYLLTGLRFKGVQEPNGLVRTWPLTESGAQAVRVLTRIGDGNGRLLAARGLRTDPSGEFPVMSNAIANFALKDFASATRELARELDLPPEYRLPDDAEDFLTLRVLRRTSEAITQEEIGGVLAGAHVAGHTVRDAYDTAQTEGYGSRMSTTKTGWGRQTTDRVEALAHLAVEAQKSIIGGPAGDRATRIAEMAVAEMELVDPANLMTPLRSKEWGRIAKALDQDVYEVELAGGYVAFCVFDITKSMCTEEGDKPSIADCRISCRNKALTKTSVAGLELRRTELEAQSEDPLLTNEERIRSQALAAEYDKQITDSGLTDEATP